MRNESYEEFQYNSCTSRGICSLNPRNSALQTVLVLYLRLFAKFVLKNELDEDTKEFILNTVSTNIYNPDLNENSYLFAIENFQKKLPKIIENYKTKQSEENLSEEIKKVEELFENTSDIIPAIKYGEKIFNRGIEKLSNEIRDLYNILLVIAKSLSINLLDLKSLEKDHEEGFNTIIDILSNINIESRSTEILKKEIINASKVDNEIMKLLRKTQEERYGEQIPKEVSFTTVPNKAVLVVGSNIKELEDILEALKNENIDIYTHDEMMLAHTFPHFSKYKKLKGQFGQGLENCLLDFATFPGPIILTKHSLHNIENLYRGRLFTTDYMTSPKGVIKINDNSFTEVIKSAKESKGFKKGKICESIEIGYNYDEISKIIKDSIDKNIYEHIFIIGLDGYSFEQRAYFEKIVKETPKSTLIISFSYKFEKENCININTCFDNYSWIKIFEFVYEFKLPITIFIPKCERSTIPQMIYISQFENIDIYLGKCTPIILNPSLMNTLQETFKIKSISSAKKDLEEIFKDK